MEGTVPPFLSPPLSTARVAAGITLASYVIAHPSLCWQWLRDRSIAQELRLVDYVLTLVALAVAAGFMRSSLIGVYLPVYGVWRMPWWDGLWYFSIVATWSVGFVFLSSIILRLIGEHFGAQPLHMRIWLGLVAFSLTPFFVSGIFVFAPFEILRTAGTCAALSGVLLFRHGVRSLEVVPPRVQASFCALSLGAVIISGFLSLWVALSILTPSYPLWWVTAPVLSNDVLEFREALGRIADS